VSRTSARFTRLEVRGASAGMTIRLSCKGRGCRFTKRTVKAARAGTATLTHLVRKARLRKGAVLEVRVTAPGHVGRVTRFSMRRNRLPKRTELCLPPGAGTPAACPA
jgi:hypothetical protein